MASEIRKQLFEVRRMSDLNLTSLMDITFVLLLVFIITLPMVEQATPIKLPSGAGQPIKPGDMLTVSIDAETRVFIGPDSLTLPELEEAARRFKEEKPESTVLLRGDEKTPHGRMMEVMQALQRAGLTRIAFATANDGKTPAPPVPAP